MLESTFIHCPGVGCATERGLWKAGVCTWSEFLANANLPITAKRRSVMEPVVAESMERHAKRDHKWFAKMLPPREHWRAYRQYKNKIAYLDIETNGGYNGDDLTVVGLYDGTELRQFVMDQNLDDFPEAIADKAVIVTFFGTGFDLPFLKRSFDMEFPQIHIDLCFAMRKLGYSGGLKRIEKEFGIVRSDETLDMDGMDAVRLWYQWWRRNDRKSLDTLLQYNAEDILNLETLLDAAWPRMVDQAFYGS